MFPFNAASAQHQTQPTSRSREYSVVMIRLVHERRAALSLSPSLRARPEPMGKPNELQTCCIDVAGRTDRLARRLTVRMSNRRVKRGLGVELGWQQQRRLLIEPIKSIASMNAFRVPGP
jgi:hypothetical protein